MIHLLIWLLEILWVGWSICGLLNNDLLFITLRHFGFQLFQTREWLILVVSLSSWPLFQQWSFFLSIHLFELHLLNYLHRVIRLDILILGWLRLLLPLQLFGARALRWCLINRSGSFSPLSAFLVWVSFPSEVLPGIDQLQSSFIDGLSLEYLVLHNLIDAFSNLGVLEYPCRYGQIAERTNQFLKQLKIVHILGVRSVVHSHDLVYSNLLAHSKHRPNAASLNEFLEGGVSFLGVHQDIKHFTLIGQFFHCGHILGTQHELRQHLSRRGFLQQTLRLWRTLIWNEAARIVEIIEFECFCFAVLVCQAIAIPNTID